MANAKVKKTFYVLSIIIFAMVIYLPLIFFNTDPQKISVIENKRLASFPKFRTADGKLNYSFLSEFEAYINDNIGFKQEAVVEDITVSYKLFHKLKVPNYILGKDENLFYTSFGNDIITLHGKNLFPETELNKLCQGYSKMGNFFENTGAKFYMMTIPNKEGVYPELYPKEVTNIASQTRVDQLDEYIQNNSKVNIINIKQALINSKGNDMLYYKSYDCTHWNMNGAFAGYTEIMKKMQLDFPQLEILGMNSFNINVTKSKGSLAHLEQIDRINKAMAFDDEIYNYELKDGYKAEISNEIPEGLEVNPNDHFYHYINNSKANMPKLLIIGDSYIYSYLIPVFAENFSEVYFVNFKSAGQLMDLQNSIQADIVLYEFVERAFNPSINSELLKFIDSKVDLADMNQLPVIADAPVFNIDQPTLENGAIPIDEGQDTTSIVGWAIDSKAEALVSDIYLKLGENYYKANFFERPDLISIKEDYLMAGFSFEVPTKELIQYDKVYFELISNDGKYQYNPIEFKVKKK